MIKEIERYADTGCVMNERGEFIHPNNIRENSVQRKDVEKKSLALFVWHQKTKKFYTECEERSSCYVKILV